MLTGDAAAFIPWRDDCLLDEESFYAFENKLAWFLQSAVPLKMVDLGVGQRHSGRPPARDPGALRLDWWADYAREPSVDLTVRGVPLRRWVSQARALGGSDVPRGWAVHVLRVCPDCIGGGVHLRINQHAAVVRCPLHATPLTHRCEGCGKVLGAFEAGQPFACRWCGQGLLRGDLDCSVTQARRAEVSARVREVQQWLAPLRSGTDIGAGAGAGAPAPTRWFDNGRLLLEAVARISPPRPDCVATYAVPEIEMTIAEWTPGRRRTRARRSVQQASAVARAISGHVSRTYSSPEAQRRILEVHRTAIVATVQAELFRWWSKHRFCLDSPLRLAGERLLRPSNNVHRLPRCCPVAVGFYLWRLALCDEYRSPLRLQNTAEALLAFGLDEAQPSAVAMLEAIERSRLHLCIVRASNPGSPGELLANDYEHMVEQAAWAGNWGAPRLGSRPGRCRRHLLAEVDASRLIDSMSCTGGMEAARHQAERLGLTPEETARFEQAERARIPATWPYTRLAKERRLVRDAEHRRLGRELPILFPSAQASVPTNGRIDNR